MNIINDKMTTSTKKNNAQIDANNKKRFKEWMKNIAKKRNDKAYATKRGTQYASGLKTVAENFPEAITPYSSIFTITDIDSFNEIDIRIRGNERFKSINGDNHNIFSSALDRYRDFLIYLNTSDENMNENNSLGVNSSPNNGQFPRNRIYFGAPGTGKSYTLNEQKKALLKNEGDYERVTFHPDYSYAHFVGTYKPMPEGKDITYSYVPGPFLRTYVKARNTPHTPVLLVIEEINRANVAAVFGDVFQLLDRDKDGVSEYPIHASEDIKKYLQDEFEKHSKDKVNPEEYEIIRIPANMYIWATMNSADQGVFPMDTAFKRRWDFIYRGIDEGDKAEAFETKITLGKDDCERTVKWNDLRKAINRKLLEYNVNEDKLMGPYFIQPDISSDEFVRVFKNKVIMYLFEDAARQKRRDLFSGCGDAAKLYSGICEEFEKKGVFIFCDSISREFGERMEETE